MTIDAAGRSHKPAGGPASTGGQFAKGAAPGAAAQLGTASTIDIKQQRRPPVRLGT